MNPIDKYFTELYAFVRGESDTSPTDECPASTYEEAVEALTVAGWVSPEEAARLVF